MTVATGWQRPTAVIFAFGDAPDNGSMGGQTLNRPIVGVTATHEFSGFLRHGHVVALDHARPRGRRGSPGVDQRSHDAPGERPRATDPTTSERAVE